MHKSLDGSKVATVLTVYGIETAGQLQAYIDYSKELQQYLPFTVLKQYNSAYLHTPYFPLQQYLPFTVLKLRYGRWCDPCRKI